VTLSKDDREKLSALSQSLPQKFRLQLTPECKAQLSAVSANPQREGLEFQIKAAITKLLHDPKYKGLNTHRFQALSEKYQCDVWESYVQNNTPGAWRLFWRYGPDEKDITLLLVTPHP
jgi:hypothetical protein